jgi:hypothetical protein
MKKEERVSEENSVKDWERAQVEAVLKKHLPL